MTFGILSCVHMMDGHVARSAYIWNFSKIHCVNNIWNITMCAYDGWACFIEVHTSLDEKF